MINTKAFAPVSTWHQNKILTGPPGVADLPVTMHSTMTGERSINSVWRLASFWERVKFLFSGQLTLRVMTGQTHPPVAIMSGDIFGVQRLGD